MSRKSTLIAFALSGVALAPLQAAAQSNASPPGVGTTINPSPPSSRSASEIGNTQLSGSSTTPAPVAGATVNPANPGSTVEEVVVTAQKRSEKLVDVPVAITALSATKLQNSGVTDMGSLAQVVPGLHVDATGSFYQPSIRGVGTAVSGQGVSPSVATYLDGVYQPNPLSNDFNFVDVTSVDVLKGPQGTLFGRNTTAGAILVTTRQPSFKPEFEVSAGYGNFNTGEGSIWVSDAITDKLAFSVAGGITASDGWIKNIADGRDANKNVSYTVRGKLLYEPISKLKLTLTVVDGRTNDPTGFAAGTYKGFTDATAFFGVPNVSDNRRNIDIQPGTFRHIIDQFGVNLKSELDLGFATLTSYTSEQREWGQEASNEAASLFAPNGTLPVQPCPTLTTCTFLGTGGYSFLEAVTFRPVEQTYSQEFDLASKPGGPFEWVTGLYYFHDKTRYSPEFLTIYGPFGAGGALTGALPPWPASSYISFPFEYVQQATAKATSLAAYADVTYNIDKWHFTLGGRVDEEVPGVSFGAPPNLANGFVNYPLLQAQKHYFRYPARAVVRYSVTPDSNAYISVSRGTKSAVYNASGFNAESAIVQPEQITDVEGGYKFSRGGTSFDTSLFYYDYKNLQASTYQNGIALIQNAPHSEMFGGDAHLIQRIITGLNADIGIAYTHARYLSFPNAVYQTFNSTYGVQNQSIDVGGGKVERTPTFTMNAGGNFTHDLFNGRFEASGNFSYQTQASFDFANTIRQGAYGLLTLRAGWTDPTAHWNVAVVARNLTDTKYLTQVLPDSGGFGSVYGEPANFMATVSYRY